MSTVSLEAALIPSICFSLRCIYTEESNLAWVTLSISIYSHIVFSHLSWRCYIFLSGSNFPHLYDTFSKPQYWLREVRSTTADFHGTIQWGKTSAAQLQFYGKCCFYKMHVIFFWLLTCKERWSSSLKAHLESALFRSLFWIKITNTPYRMTGSAVNVCIVDTYYQMKSIPHVQCTVRLTQSSGTSAKI